MLEVRAEGEGDLAQLFDLILFGDYVSLWMAVEAGVDPGPVPVIEELKGRLGPRRRPPHGAARCAGRLPRGPTPVGPSPVGGPPVAAPDAASWPGGGD